MSEGTSLVMESSDEDDNVVGVEQDGILSRQTSVSLVPFMGQRFVSQEAAYEFYCTFAKQRGFSIRRHRTRGKDGVGRGITRRDFACHRSGFPQTKQTSSDEAKPHRNRKSARCGCQAYMRIVKRAEFDHHVPEWRVTGFVDLHNHELLRSKQVCHLPGFCPISSDDKTRICMFDKAGMSVRQMLRLLELEKGVKLGCLPFTELDVRNLLQSFRNVGENDGYDNDIDPIDLVSMCKTMKDQDPSFAYDYKIDRLNRLENIAWSYGSSLRSYDVFGDAVVFDTTCRLDGFDMLFGVFLGINNHGSTCFFGCVLLRDENVQSFSWALKAFLGFVKGKYPQTILTDHNTWLKDAILSEMPRTKHAISIWHIVSKFTNWFSVLLGPRYDEWKSDFHDLYSTEFVEDFDGGWRDSVEKYGLHTNRHAMSLYALRSFWAFAFLRQFFFAGLMSSSQAESINAFVQRLTTAQSQLDRFVQHLADIVEHKDRGSLKNRTQQQQPKYPKISLKTGSPIESHAASVLTPYAFTKLQDEIVSAQQFASVMVDEGCFQVRHHSQIGSADYFKVVWLPCQDHISCSCHRFEFLGILCRHVLRVLSTNNCFHVPDPYLPTRWRTTTTASPAPEKLRTLESIASSLVAESVETEERLGSALEHLSAALSRIRELPRGGPISYGCDHDEDSLILQDVEDRDGIVRFSIENALDEAVSSGKLKERRGDMARKRRHCVGPCFGNDGPECQLIGGDHLTSDGIGYL